ncbi:hypothetical protein [Paucibacter sp. PLA-PC-4]|uniref:hypothetical protein n=1 Tax=Paucibacter sp. PLA-PC-4 TaxID=2993655 RepID=UPI003A4C584D
MVNGNNDSIVPTIKPYHLAQAIPNAALIPSLASGHKAVGAGSVYYRRRID